MKYFWVILLLGVSSCTTQTKYTDLRPTDTPVTRIAFGSCVKESKPQPVWAAINALKPDVFVFLGDNIYADTIDPQEMKAKYDALGSKPGFKKLRQQSVVLATWDDHDYGQNDAGQENPIKAAARELMMDFWQEPLMSKRRKQKGGIYTAHTYKSHGKTVQIILLDLRWNRTALKKVSAETWETRKRNNQGPYEPNWEDDAVFLGAEQWQWLELEMAKPADLKIVASSLQMIPEFTGWESWANFPKARERFFGLIRDLNLHNVVIISGDTHWAEISEYSEGLPSTLTEITSSGLTEEWQLISPNRYRTSKAVAEANFGHLDIHWQSNPIQVEAFIRDKNGRILIEKVLSIPLPDVRNPAVTYFEGSVKLP